MFMEAIHEVGGCCLFFALVFLSEPFFKWLKRALTYALTEIRRRYSARQRARRYRKERRREKYALRLVNRHKPRYRTIDFVPRAGR